MELGRTWCTSSKCVKVDKRFKAIVHKSTGYIEKRDRAYIIETLADRKNVGLIPLTAMLVELASNRIKQGNIKEGMLKEEKDLTI